MNSLKKTLAILLCGALCIGSMASCSGKNGDESSENGETAETAEKTQVLTNVFRGTKAAVPEEYTVNRNVTPYYNEETGETTMLCTHSYDSGETDEEGNYIYVRDTLLVTLTSSGTMAGETKVELREENHIDSGVLTADKLYFTTNEYNDETGEDFYYVSVYNCTDGTLTRSEEISRMFTETEEGAPWFYINCMAVDRDGDIYLNSEQEVLVLGTDFVKKFSVMASSWINNMVTSADGTVYAEGYFGEDGQSFVPIDKTTKAFGGALALPDSIRANQYFFGKGYDIYYTDQNDIGLYGYNFPEDGTDGEGVLLFNFANSDLYADNIDLAKIVDPDHVILYERDAATYKRCTMLYSRSADVDLSQLRVLEIAFAESDYDLASQIVQFNKANDGVRIVAKDYGVYRTDEDYEAGYKKLAQDIVNGLYQPDIVTAVNTSNDVIEQIYANGLYTDLYSFIDTGEKVRRDDLLGCVKRTFETEDGQLWTIGRSVTVRTLVGPASLLGERNGWTLSEMVEFAQSLPEGTYLMDHLTQERAAYEMLGSNGYGMFVDLENHTCDFETEDFLNYLRYLNSLPAGNTASSRAEAEAAASGGNSEEKYLLYHNGQIALREEYYYGINTWVREEAWFNTPDVVRIGYPTADGASNGTAVDTAPYIITSFCEYPAEAWAFLESLLAPEDTDDMYRSGRDGIPALKSQLMKLCEEYYTYLFEVDIDGNGMSWGPYNPEYDDLDAPMSEPGYRTFFTEEDAAELFDWLDNKIGCPVTETVDEEITDIVNEEITSYLGGAKTAEDCARIIQSRVSIWLAEHQ